METQIFELKFAIDTFYFLVCGILVMWMAAGFAMLEAGLVRSKNTTEILTKNIALYAIASIAYLVCGYQIMYGGGFFLSNVETVANFSKDAAIAASTKNGFGGNSVYAGAADFFFQVVFVGAAMSIVSGAVAERMKLWVFLTFSIVMTGFIYPLEGSWTWGNQKVLGIFSLNFSDYAGSGIVHLAGASAALAAVLLLGARKGKYGKNGKIYAIPGANLPLSALGTMILWMGWFGFNGGSTLKIGGMEAANEVANVILNTNAAAAGGAVSAIIISQLMFKKADLTMLLNGALAGLVAITAEPAAPTPLIATTIGIIAGILVFFAILGFDRLKLDDPVGALSVHGVCGFFGVMVVPLTNKNASFIGQLTGAFTIFSWVFITSFIIWYVLKKTVGLRISEEEEYEGADISECGLSAYPEFTISNTK